MTTSSGSKEPPPMPLIYVPAQGAPKQLFVLLHDDASSPGQLSHLAQSIKQAFPQSMVVLPYAPLQTTEDVRHWFDQNGLTEENYVERVRAALPGLVSLIQRLQRQYQFEGEHTALAGFGQGATIALEAVHAQLDLAGRVLAFSGSYAKLPDMAPPATTLHFLHGEEDPIVPVDFMHETHKHMAEIQGDATLDIASRIGHELHDALVRQAIYRLQTCVPLRSWKSALGELRNEPEGIDLQDLDPPNPTLH
ncbi:esterase [Pusillimonas sp.]|uniref:esterase n=1 Tax=Pusillimonas sp. TaxID=3040095 RepID=UPI0037CC3182